MFENLIARLASELAARDVPYMVIGGQAVLIHGEPRLTRDIDITLGVTPERLDTVLAAVDMIGLKVLVEAPHPFVRDTWVLPCEDSQSGIRVDIVFSHSHYEQLAIARAVRVTMGTQSVCFASAEDLVVQKLVAGRPRDLEDARTVMLKNPTLDRGYLLQCLTELDAETGLPVLTRYAELQASLENKP